MLRGRGRARPARGVRGRGLAVGCPETGGCGLRRPEGWPPYVWGMRGAVVGRGLDPSAGGCPGAGGSGRLPLIRPCGATFPQGGRQELLLAAAGVSAGRRGRRPLRFARGRAAAGGRGEVGAPRPTDGDMETLWGLRGHPFPGRRAVGAGHARPGGLRGHPSMVRSVGRGLDPSAGVGGSGSLRGWLPGEGRQREPAPHPALRGHLPPWGKARAVVGGSGSLPLPRQLVLGAELEGQAVVPAV